MNRKETLTRLTQMREMVSIQRTRAKSTGGPEKLMEAWGEALQTAIRVLGNYVAMDSDLVSRKALLNAYDAMHKGPPGKARRLIANMPPVQAVQLTEVTGWSREEEFDAEKSMDLYTGRDE